METHSVFLTGATYQRWTKLKQYLGFTSSSDFVEHILDSYEGHNNIPHHVRVSKQQTNNEKETIINGVRIKQEFIDIETNSSDSLETYSGKASPDPSYQNSKKDVPSHRTLHPRKRHRAAWGLESVVQRLHQAKVDSRDEDGWIKQEEGEDGVETVKPSQLVNTIPQVKQEVVSDDGMEYQSPRIIPDSARSLSNPFPSQERNLCVNLNSTYTLRKLLERPPVNASAALRLNAAELKERGVVINPAISYQENGGTHPTGAFEPHQHPAGHSPTVGEATTESQPPHREVSNSLALDSLLQLALQVKKDEGLREKGSPGRSESEILHSMQEQGISLGTFQKSLLQLPQAFKKAGIPLNGSPPLPYRGGPSSDRTGAPSLKNILQRSSDENTRPEGLSTPVAVNNEEQPRGSEETPHSVASAADALRHLAQMQEPTQKLVLTKLASIRLNKGTPHKRFKQRRRYRSGSKRNYSNPLPTVKYLLEKKREGAPSKHRSKSKGKKDLDLKGISSKSSVKAHYLQDVKTTSVSGGEFLLSRKYRKRDLSNQEGVNRKSGRKKQKTGRKLPQRTSPRLTNKTFVHAPGVSVASASQVMKLLAEQEHPPNPTPTATAATTFNTELPSVSAPFKTEMPSSQMQSSHMLSPQVENTSSSSPSFNNSASEVMKLLASKNQPLVQSKTPSSSSLQSPRTGISTPINTAASTPPPKFEGLKMSGVGAADIMKHLASSYSQGSAPGLQYPLSLMFATPPASDSSSAFSLMKQLITKGSS